MPETGRIRSVERLNQHLPVARMLAVIPTYNEREYVPLLLEAFAGLEPTVDLLIVDDASPDGTANLFSAAASTFPRRLTVIQRQDKAGLGTAYIDGFSWALEHLPEYQVLVQMDADFSHDPSAVAALAEHAVMSGACIGSRYVPGGSMPDWKQGRKLLSRLANVYARSVLRLFSPSYAVQDSTAGFVAWRRDVLAQLLTHEVPGAGYGFQISMKYLAHRLGVSLVEHPIVFRDRRLGQSKLSKAIVIEALGIVWWLGRKFRAVKPLVVQRDETV